MKFIAKSVNKKRKRIKKYCLKNFHNFSVMTRLPAMQFIGDEKLPKRTRLFFLIGFVITCILSLDLGLEIFDKWNNTPVIIGLKSSTTPIESIPFPAVTVCNMNRALRSKVYNYTAATLEYAFLNRICFQELNYTAYGLYKPVNIGDNLLKFILKHSQPCDRMMVSCKFGNVQFNCTELFKEAILDEGLCCVFNVLHPYYLYKGSYKTTNSYIISESIPVDWSPENGFDENLPPKFYPRLAIGPGVSLGLSIVLNADIHDYFCSTTNGAGFKVSIHNAIDTPHVKDTGLPIALGHQSRFRLDISSTEAELATSSIRPQFRKCFFSDERPLFYYKHYTRRNCESECDSQFMLRTCYCIPHHMPLIYENVSVCRIIDFDCVARAEKDYENEMKQNCKQECLPGCFELNYFPTMFSTPIAIKEYIMEESFFYNLSKEYVRDNFALAHFYFNYNSFRSSVRTTYTGLTEFLSQTGGIMSLLMGFSVVSIAEFFYYTILRPFLDYFRRLKRVSSSDSTRTTRSFTYDVDDEVENGLKLTQNNKIFFIKANQMNTQFKGNLRSNRKIKPRALRRRFIAKNLFS